MAVPLSTIPLRDIKIIRFSNLVLGFEGTSWLEGNVYVAEVYESALSAEDIANLYAGNFADVSATPRDIFNADDISGTTWVNSGTGSDGTLTNVTVNSENPLQPTFRSVLWDDFNSIPSYLLDSWFKFEKPTGKACAVSDVVTTTIFGLTDTTYGNMDTWHGGGSCGAGVTDFSALKDSEGNYIYDSDGYNIFTKDDR